MKLMMKDGINIIFIGEMYNSYVYILSLCMIQLL